MAKQTGVFIDDARLRPRDNSGGPMGPKGISDFGSGGKTTGGEPANTKGAEDEFTASRGKGRPMGKGMY